jgi:SAM-dependent methyltransferase
VITVSARTGILPRLATAPGTADQVAGELELDPLATGKILRALTALGLLDSDDDGSFCITGALAPHFLPGPDALTPFLLHHHEMYERWGETLEPWARGEPARSNKGPPDPATFGAAMQAMGAQVSKLVASRLDLDGIGRVLDVGGGFGHYSRALCRIKPELEAVVLDKPEVVRLGREQIAGSELEDRITFQEGDYLTSDLGQGYDLVLAANILHQESQERAAGLVTRCAAALAQHGRLAVVDFSIDDRQRQSVLGALFAINMRSFGDTHPEPRISGWMEAAGLTGIRRTDLNRHRWLITGRRTRP